MSIIDGKTGRDITEEHYASMRISEQNAASSRRAWQTANAKPSGQPVRDLRAEGNAVGTMISDPMAIHEAMKYDT